MDHPLLKVRRGPELLMRWMEVNAFTTIFRTHEVGHVTRRLPVSHVVFVIKRCSACPSCAVAALRCARRLSLCLDCLKGVCR